MVDMMCQHTAAGGGGGGNAFGVAYLLVFVPLFFFIFFWAFFLRPTPFLLLLRFVLTVTSLHLALLLPSFAQAASHSLRLETTVLE